MDNVSVGTFWGLVRTANWCRAVHQRVGAVDLLKSKEIKIVFWQESTRTRGSFETAAGRLGARYGTTVDAGKYTSELKGESFEDTIRSFSKMCDLMILRTKEKGSARRAALVSHVPIISAGDGAGEHPTQALLDAYVLNERIPNGVPGKTIAFTGDLRDSRTARSLARMLRMMKPARYIFASPPELGMTDDIKRDVSAAGIAIIETSDLRFVQKEADAVYHQRPQNNNRTGGESAEEIASGYRSFIIDKAFLEGMKPEAIVHHPGPHTFELTEEASLHPKCVMFPAMEMGVYMRMAVLLWVFGIECP
ncbi:aspartate carbamoyltransferase [Candidatus Uhrbacteria bacterium]|nr:aspartate carbamoyltransferase [Candidatus Uhrbacteria bacterium]